MGNPIILRGRDAPLAEPEAYATSRGKLVAIGEIGEGEFRPEAGLCHRLSIAALPIATDFVSMGTSKRCRFRR